MRGGKRKGAGRPKTGSNPQTVKRQFVITRDNDAFLDRLKCGVVSRSAVVNTALSVYSKTLNKKTKSEKAEKCPEKKV